MHARCDCWICSRRFKGFSQDDTEQSFSFKMMLSVLKGSESAVKIPSIDNVSGILFPFYRHLWNL